MTECLHKQLTLLKTEKSRLRCRHCHLTLSEQELGEGYCPECYEVDGIRRYEFEKVEEADSGSVTYRCEGCGISISCG
jgi:hypothetical protein